MYDAEIEFDLIDDIAVVDLCNDVTSPTPRRSNDTSTKRPAGAKPSSSLSKSADTSIATECFRSYA